ncbi:MAG TPA: SDR family NAD(P)-dependent oxidoreductase [Kofleriaceae bacterium]|nr:SDR family NAD(P)-dependent oxidoreductase [Kofleriaceae bacterium]
MPSALPRTVGVPSPRPPLVPPGGHPSCARPPGSLCRSAAMIGAPAAADEVQTLSRPMTARARTTALDGRVAVVTGGSRGIGRGIALGLADSGADVVVNYRTRGEEAAAVVREIEALGRRAIAVGADVSRESEIDRLFADASAALGPIDVLVSNAGIANPATIDTLNLARWDEAIAVNLRSAFLVSTKVIPSMRSRRWGRIIYITSTAAQTGGIVGPHYAASKAGLIGLMHGYASWLARDGITVNAVAPALIETDMTTASVKARTDRIPVGRLGRVEEVAGLVCEIAANSYITGQTFQVNGGLYMT